MLDLLMIVVLSYLDPAIFDEKNTSIGKKIHRFNISQIWTLLNQCIFFGRCIFLAKRAGIRQSKNTSTKYIDLYIDFKTWERV